jgi:MSHA biogenesis protein MshI
MKWPWQFGSTDKRLVMSWAPGELAYVQALARDDGWSVERLGVERQGQDSEAAFLKRLQSLGLQDDRAVVVLRPSQYQLLQIDAPAVEPQELRAAVRWQIAGLVDQPLEDLVIDVLPVGDDNVRRTNQLFVVAAEQSVIARSMALAKDLHVDVVAIDIQDTAQRNLQLLQLQDQVLEGAHAAIALTDERQALLTISACGELQYTRRLDLEPGVCELDRHHEERERWGGEIQRSLDVWDRTAPALHVDRISLYAGASTQALSRWLGQYLGQAVFPMDLQGSFEGLESHDLQTHSACWPLLGGLLREHPSH